MAGARKWPMSGPVNGTRSTAQGGFLAAESLICSGSSRGHELFGEPRQRANQRHVVGIPSASTKLLLRLALIQ